MSIDDSNSSPSMGNVLAARDLRKRYGRRVLLEGVNLALERGTITTVSGPSGGGKTTLLRILGFLAEPDSGTVSIHGADVRTISPEEARRRVALVAQAPAMFEGTVLDNVRTGPRLKGKSLSEEEARGALQRTGLDLQLMMNDARQLSGGEKLRVALARALVLSPEVWLLDEPTAALDPGHSDLVVELLRSLAADGAPVLVVTHDARVLERLGGRHLTLAGGHLGMEVEHELRNG